jgi:hypothetical protein
MEVCGGSATRRTGPELELEHFSTQATICYVVSITREA